MAGMRFTLRHLLISIAAPLAGRVADNTPTTPMRDTAGDWSFAVDDKLPNVLILGDSISIGYTRVVRAALAGKTNRVRPRNHVIMTLG